MILISTKYVFDFIIILQNHNILYFVCMLNVITMRDVNDANKNSSSRNKQDYDYQGINTCTSYGKCIYMVIMLSILKYNIVIILK